MTTKALVERILIFVFQRSLLSLYPPMIANGLAARILSGRVPPIGDARLLWFYGGTL